MVNLNDLEKLDSTGIGWAEVECSFDFNLNYLTKKILNSIYYN